MTRSDRHYAGQSADYLMARIYRLALVRRLESGDNIENNRHHELIDSEIARLNLLTVADC